MKISDLIGKSKEHFTLKEVDKVYQEAWKKGFEAGVKEFAKKHRQLIIIFSDN